MSSARPEVSVFVAASVRSAQTFDSTGHLPGPTPGPVIRKPSTSAAMLKRGGQDAACRRRAPGEAVRIVSRANGSTPVPGGRPHPDAQGRRVDGSEETQLETLVCSCDGRSSTARQPGGEGAVVRLKEPRLRPGPRRGRTGRGRAADPAAAARGSQPSGSFLLRRESRVASRSKKKSLDPRCRTAARAPPPVTHRDRGKRRALGRAALEQVAPVQRARGAPERRRAPRSSEAGRGARRARPPAPPASVARPGDE